MPRGMILVLTYFGLSAAGGILELQQSFVVLGPFLITGMAFFVYVVLATAGRALAFGGILTRKRWAWPLCVFWPIFEMAVATLSFALFVMYPQQSTRLANQVSTQYIREHFKIIARFLTGSASSGDITTEMIQYAVGFLASWVVGIIAIVFLTRQKHFFSR